MLKGHTKIILKDVATGREEVHEDNNLVTAALNKIINIEMAMNRAPNTDILPIATNALGGLMLFDGTLDESESNIHFPVDAHLVGYGDQNVNTTDKFRGSYNAQESGKTENGYVSTWDFGTSQANGTIKAVARTHKWGGQNPLRFMKSSIFAGTSSGVPQTDYAWQPIRYDGTYLYLLKGDSGTHVMRLARVKVPRMSFGAADYSDVARTYEVIASWSTEVFTYTYYNNEQHSIAYEQTVYADDPQMYEDGQDGYIYCMWYKVYSRITDFNYDINYFTIKYSDDSYDKSDTVHLNSGTSYYTDAGAYSVHYARRYFGHVNHGILYRFSNSRKIVYAIPLNNVASYRAVRVLADDSPDYLANMMRIAPHNGGIFYIVFHYTQTSYFYQNGILYPDGVFVTIEVEGTGDQNYWDYLRTNDDDLTVWSSYYSTEYMTARCDWASNYLGTINNLTSPITKTAAQTMKIVYTLTDTDEE